MIKNLLMTAAVAAMALSASAETQVNILDSFGTSGWSSSYDADTKTITYEGDWTGRGWWLGGVDYSEYDKVVIEFAECNLAGQVVIQYADDVNETTSFALGAESVEALFNPDYSSNVQQIYIQCASLTENPTIVLKDAYLVSGVEYNPVIWEGSQAIDWWSNAVYLSVASLSEAVEGATMAVTYELPAGAQYGNLKIQSLNADWSQTYFTSYADQESVEEGVLTFTESGVLSFVINAEDVALIKSGIQSVMLVGSDCTITKVEVIPAEAEPQYIYVVGDFQGWDLANALVVEGVDNVYGFEAEGISAFKFSTVYDGDNWELFNSGAYTLNTNAVIGENALVPGDWNIALPWAGDYTIVIDLNNMIIELATDTPEPVVDTTIYLRGYMNDWGADEAYAFTEGEDGLYTLTLSMVEEGVEFKFATEDWETVDMGGVLDMLPGIVYTLTWHEASNCSLARTLYDVTFTLDVDASTVIVDGTTGIESIAADAENAVYYNLQGVRVANPERGTFVKVVNGKATKVAF
ncbi:MAG: hypothetical protein LIP09_01570 [Bacteroidales bacterium]|nr:hypothetical protein [Bacteroidales bacterium]